MRLPSARWLQQQQLLLPRRSALPGASVPVSAVAAPFTTSAHRALKPMPPRPPPPPEDEIEEMFVKGTGPGGQKINKTNSAVQLIHRPTGIVVKSQATRSRSQNRNIARQVLAARLDELHNGSQSRTAIVADAKQRKKASASKKSRRKYRKLKEEEEEGEEETEGVEGKGQQQDKQQLLQNENVKEEQSTKEFLPPFHSSKI